MYKWEAVAIYEDGSSIRKTFPYDEDGCYLREEERQFDIENWLISRHPGCDWYSVTVIEEEE